MKIDIVVEKKNDADMLRSSLPSGGLSGVRFFASDGRISGASLSRNLLVKEGGFVFLLLPSSASKDEFEVSHCLLKNVANPDRFEVMPLDSERLASRVLEVSKRGR